jgi:hypothetical protein
MTCECSYLSVISTITSLFFIISEFLPYASSSRCNSVLEALSHILCKNNCLKSNKAIMYDNTELTKEVQHLKNEIVNLTSLRTSLEIQRVDESV